MQCPECFSKNTLVIDSRPVTQAIKRRRKCENCKHRFTSYEMILSDIKDVGIKYIGQGLKDIEIGKIVKKILSRSLRNNLKEKDFL